MKKVYTANDLWVWQRVRDEEGQFTDREHAVPIKKAAGTEIILPVLTQDALKDFVRSALEMHLVKAEACPCGCTAFVSVRGQHYESVIERLSYCNECGGVR